MSVRDTYPQTRLDDAIDRGYDPHPDDLVQVEPLPADDPWMQALAESTRIVRTAQAAVPS